MTTTRARPFALALAGLMLSGGAVQAGDFDDRPELTELVTQTAAASQRDPEALRQILTQARRDQRVLDLMARAPERRKEWFEYKQIFLTETRVQQGLEFWKTHELALNRAQETYGVPPEYILAILGVETSYGRNKGSFPVLDALATLAFDHPVRYPFFRQELQNFLQLTQENGLNPTEIRGSYAGAMGFPQFMPSSWRRLAVDFDEDGRIDLINNPVDAIGSIAHYFQANGWRARQPVTQPIVMPAEVPSGLVSQSLSPVTTVAALAEAGVQGLTGLDPTWRASAVQFLEDTGPIFQVALPNFYVITTYNRSILYALAAHVLAQQLRQAKLTRVADPAL